LKEWDHLQNLAMQRRLNQDHLHRQNPDRELLVAEKTQKWVMM